MVQLDTSDMLQPAPCDDERLADSRRWAVASTRRRAKTPQDAEDIVQNVMERMVRKFRHLPDDEWQRVLATVTVREAARFYATRWSDLLSTESLSPERLPVAPEDATERCVIARAELKGVLARGQAVSGRGLRAYVRNKAFGITYREQAAEEGVSADALQRSASRVRTVMRSDGRWASVLLCWLPRRLRRFGVGHLLAAASAGGVVTAAVVIVHAHADGYAPGVVASVRAPQAQAHLAGRTPAPSASPTVTATPGITGPPASISQGQRPTSAPSPTSPPMHQLVGASIGNPSSVGAGAAVQRDDDHRSPIQQALACVIKGPSLDPHKAGCPT